MKVHKAGDLPLMQVGTFNLAIMLKMWLTLPWRIEFLQIYNSIIKDDKSTWTKIESTSSDMVTRFVSIKGEKTDAKDGFRDLPVIMMVIVIVMVTQLVKMKREKTQKMYSET